MKPGYGRPKICWASRTYGKTWKSEHHSLGILAHRTSDDEGPGCIITSSERYLSSMKPFSEGEPGSLGISDGLIHNLLTFCSVGLFWYLPEITSECFRMENDRTVQKLWEKSWECATGSLLRIHIEICTDFSVEMQPVQGFNHLPLMTKSWLSAKA